MFWKNIYLALPTKFEDTHSIVQSSNIPKHVLQNLYMCASREMHKENVFRITTTKKNHKSP